MRSKLGSGVGLLASVVLLSACGDADPGSEHSLDPVLYEGADAGRGGVVTDAATLYLDAGSFVSSPADAGFAAITTVPEAGTPVPDAGTSTATGAGVCCTDGNCLCHGPAPSALTADPGPYKTQSYALAGAGCVFYPTDAEPPFAAVTVSDGFGGSGGCGALSQTGQWGPLYASWGIVAMIVNTGSGDQPNARGQALTKGVAAFKAENDKASSPLHGKLAGRYGTSGFSMGGGGTTYATQSDPSLLSSIAIMPWGPVTTGIKVPTLVICGSSDTIAACAQHGTPAYQGIADSVPKMRVKVTSGHAGQPTAGAGMSGKYGLAFNKVFLEGDQRWRPLVVGAASEATNIK